MTEREKRQRFPIVDRSLQYRFLVMILAYSAMIMIFLALFLFLPDIMKLYDEGLSLEARAIAADRILTLHARVWPAVIALICIIGIHSFRALLRILGPLYRFRWAFEEVQNGNLGLRVKLREKDYLRREEKAINEMIETLSGKLKTIQLAGGDALKSLDELEQIVTKKGDLTETDRKVLRVHRHDLDALMDTARYFQLETDEREQR
ncbi:MAG: methyl-accepting chemotaxis protein [Desulfobacterales bacterium]|nr:methyl-accepting chemotaxis protein [Desulfobacterales bacterium]